MPLELFRPLPGLVEGLEVEVLDIPGLSPVDEPEQEAPQILGRRNGFPLRLAGAGPARFRDDDLLARAYRLLRAAVELVQLRDGLLDGNALVEGMDVDERWEDGRFQGCV